MCGVHLRDSDGHDFQVSAELVVGADGVRSTVADLVGAQRYRTARHATGSVFSYWSNTGIDGTTGTTGPVWPSGPFRPTAASPAYSPRFRSIDSTMTSAATRPQDTSRC